MSERFVFEPFEPFESELGPVRPYIAGLEFPGESVGFPTLEDFERPDFDLGSMMERRLEQLDVRPPTIDEFDADKYVSGRLEPLTNQQGGANAYLDRTTGLRVDTATAERYIESSSQETWLLSDTGRAYTVEISRLQLDDPRRPPADYLERRLALDTALRRRAYLAGSTLLQATVVHESNEVAVEGETLDQVTSAEVKGVNGDAPTTSDVAAGNGQVLLSLEEWQQTHPPMTAQQKRLLARRVRRSMIIAADTPSEAWPAVDPLDSEVTD